ncbi:transcription elongation factor GreB [Nibrella saemangeumensis]|uniref:Transcription elongation factor GreB n=1 Tax=Nibrella saemangeumensis TaxID=1084526 RepID=A0ABP8NDQ4_9BACT
MKNESADDPVFIPARAPLPPGTPNYVTPRGLSLLRAELTELESERSRVQADENDETERSRQISLLNGRIAKLNERIASARVVEPHSQPHDEVRFGATVTLRPRSGKYSGRAGTQAERQLTIVGVDEADLAQGLIAFTAPVARAMQGKKVGDLITLPSVQGEGVLEIVGIAYDSG